MGSVLLSVLSQGLHYTDTRLLDPGVRAERDVYHLLSWLAAAAALAMAVTTALMTRTVERRRKASSEGSAARLSGILATLAAVSALAALIAVSYLLTRS